MIAVDGFWFGDPNTLRRRNHGRRCVWRNRLYDAVSVLSHNFRYVRVRLVKTATSTVDTPPLVGQRICHCKSGGTDDSNCQHVVAYLAISPYCPRVEKERARYCTCDAVLAELALKPVTLLSNKVQR
jgi:hypothetical protein